MGTRIKATQLRTSSISDLTNTTWIINNSPDVQVTMSEEIYNISFNSNNTSFVKFGIVYDIGSDTGDGPLNQGLNYYYDSYSSDKVYNSRTNIWNNDAYKTIEITGGTDVTNATLISWLEANATNITPEPSGTNHTHLGSLSIIKKHFGDLEVIKETLNGVTIYEKGSPSPSLISFTIADKSYQAEDGMTWSQWVASAYNTNGFTTDGSAILNSSYTQAVTTSNTGYNYVSPSSTITADFTYYLRNYNG